MKFFNKWTIGILIIVLCLGLASCKNQDGEALETLKGTAGQQTQQSALPEKDAEQSVLPMKDSEQGVLSEEDTEPSAAEEKTNVKQEENEKEESQEKMPVEETETEEEKPKEKDRLEITASKMYYTKEHLIQKAELIFKGKVLKKEKEYMTNPDGTLQQEGWGVIPNAQVAEYTVEIQELYKGEYNEKTITVKTVNGYNLSPDLILYGEDEHVILDTPLERIDFEVGKECILMLVNVANSIGGNEDGYQSLYGRPGYFPLQEDGTYKTVDTDTGYTLSKETLKQEIESALKK